MAATALSAIITRVRDKLLEDSASHWTDAELLADMGGGILDLYKMLVDLHEWHYATVDESNVSVAANASSLTGVPSDVMRVLLIEPRDTTVSGSTPHVKLTERKYNHPDAINGRAAASLDPSTPCELFYSITQAGAPVGAPTIYVAPKLSSALPLRFVYVPQLAPTTFDATTDTNPIPGESDEALVAWTIAHALSKDREDRMPHPGWMQKYGTEKEILRIAMGERDESESEVVEDLFLGYM